MRREKLPEGFVPPVYEIAGDWVPFACYLGAVLFIVLYGFWFLLAGGTDVVLYLLGVGAWIGIARHGWNEFLVRRQARKLWRELSE